MLSKETFVKSLGYLNAFYMNFKLDITDEYSVEVWYEPFVTMEDRVFKNLVKSYCKSEVYPPSSPTSLLTFFRETMKLSELSGERAWQIAYDEVKACGFDVQRAIDNLDNPKIKTTLSELKHRFRNLLTAQVVFVEKDFIKIYNGIVNEQANLLLMGNDLLKIETKGE